MDQAQVRYHSRSHGFRRNPQPVITVDGEEHQTFSAGDAFFIKRGKALTFDVTSPFLKHWMAYDPDSS